MIAVAVLYDAGLTPDAVARNLDVLEVPVGDLRAIVISHGHADHHGGLEGLVRRRGRSRLPLVIHPDAWRERRVVFPTGGELRLPPPSRHDLEAEGLEVVEERATASCSTTPYWSRARSSASTEFETRLSDPRGPRRRRLGARSDDLGRPGARRQRARPRAGRSSPAVRTRARSTSCDTPSV